MTTITLGQNGPAVVPLCVGTWAWGDKLFWNYGSNYGAAEVEAAFNTSLDAGVNFFDTAEVYGNGLSEELLGQFIKKTTQPVQIATKFGPVPWRLTGKSVSEALTASLKRLQVEQITLYQVHWPFTFLLSQETLMNALADEVKQGRIQAVGVSNYTAEQMREAHKILTARGVPLATNQVRYSLLSRQVEKQGIVSAGRELGVTILAYSPLAQGLLTDKYNAQEQPAGARKLDSKFSESGLKKIELVMSTLRKMGRKRDRTPAQVALNWLICQNGVIPIPGAKNAKQAAENAGALDWRLSQDEVNQLELMTRPWRE
ncbi:MAG: aldo/keto reductase [Microcoleus sp. SU_5_3]|nr:aldo/keto reductase [Microcoleus sp. SU_5_3]NJL67924.1 aldo/keto reductase [Microcoleus sp. SM1_3_4]